MANKENETNTEKERRYNGWTNYETWAVALWIDNEEGSQGYWREEAERHVEEASECEAVRDAVWSESEAARFNLADQLKDEITDASPEMEASVYSDLLQSAFDSVNWHEIADNMLSELDN